MTNYNDLERREARLIVLKALADQNDERMNSSMLCDVLAVYGINQTREWLNQELKWMENMGAVVLTEVGSVVIAQLTEKGARHLSYADPIEGIRRPSRPGV